MKSKFCSLFDTLSSSYEDRSLPHAIVESLCREPGRIVLIDCTQKPKIWTAAQVLALSYALAKRWKDWPEQRVGIVLPPGFLAIVANLGLILAAKKPVNLNFSASNHAIAFSIQTSGVQRVISAKAIINQLKDFPWPQMVIDLQELLRSFSTLKIGIITAMGRFLPIQMLKRIWSIPMPCVNDEAILLFTSGSEGTPKGVPLTHRNLLANCDQIQASTALPQRVRILSALPLFHSFGFTVTMLYPVLKTATAISVPNPLNFEQVAFAVNNFSVEVLVGTPTLFRSYLKRIDPNAFQSIRYVVAGAEKTPQKLKINWEEAFDSLYLEGYGLTETAPVVSVNLPNLADIVRSREGSVGKLLPGICARTVNPQTLKPLAVGQFGLIELRGPNVFGGYFQDQASNSKIFHQGWFITGDLGWLDADGFLYIEGRLSRFSKIGGEMVSHGALEIALMDLFETAITEELCYSITSVEDRTRGETIVLLSKKPLDLNTVRCHLFKKNIPALWHPRLIVHTDSIPILASGKIDLNGCRKIIKDFVK